MQAAWRQDFACQSLVQPLEKSRSCLWFDDESQIDHFAQVKEPFGKTEAIRVQFPLLSRLSHQDTNPIMSEKNPQEFLSDSLWGFGAQDLALSSLRRFDLINHQFDFPAFMIPFNQRESRSRQGIEQRRDQSIHLALFSQPIHRSVGKK